jgi:hypothetical protein
MYCATNQRRENIRNGAAICQPGTPGSSLIAHTVGFELCPWGPEVVWRQKAITENDPFVID